MGVSLSWTRPERAPSHEDLGTPCLESYGSTPYGGTLRTEVRSMEVRSMEVLR